MFEHKCELKEHNFRHLKLIPLNMKGNHLIQNRIVLYSDVKGETVQLIYGWLYAKVCPLSHLKAQFFKNKASFKHTIYCEDFY